ncbi:hypothetical protein LCGC14_1081530 [marine sediment metagenome]|uniref:DUF2383 domain-containing protein n=1 Tax=marine sediment metagenome TaxID=412755 RepID=A0A0F9N2M9_9ZZZZ
MEEKDKKISEDIMQHKKDANKVLKALDTMECNVEGQGGKNDWKTIVEARKEHINAFLESLDKQEKQFEHFK